MKKMIMIASLLSLLTIALPVCAEEAHHPAGQPAPEAAQMNPEKLDAEVQQMQEMRNKIANEKDPAARKELMRQHMQMMQDGMKMMNMMGGQGMMGGKGMMQGEQPAMKDKQDTGSMPMADRMAMMEKKMAMMENMMSGGMMGQKGMMEKRMGMMQEIMKGMMTQQEMMMK